VVSSPDVGDLSAERLDLGAGNIMAFYDSTAGQWKNIQYDALSRRAGVWSIA
jgi:hypothetical protein